MTYPFITRVTAILIVFFIAIIYFIKKRYILTSHNKTIFKTHLTTLSKDIITNIFSISDDIDQDILTATDAFNNIPNLKIMLHDGGVIADEFINAKLKSYALQDQQNIHLMKHTHYISNLLNIRSFHKCYTTYSKRIIISAMLDELFNHYSNTTPPLVSHMK